MKALMFGWEFPPHILGGLGTASYGLTRGMWECGDMDITFVIPKPYGDEDRSFARIIGTSQVPVAWRQVDREYVDARIGKLMSPELYFALRDHIYADFNYMRTNDLGCIEFSGRYPDNLLEEINNYSITAGVIARTLDFDIIHSHDWLTYPAGKHAKQVTGKPLVVHVHATEYDRSRGKPNPTVYGIERDGMTHADHIITVSNLTRQTVIDHYGIDPSKVTTVHNAVVPLDAELLAIPNPRQTKEKVVTFLGRITMQKGPEYFVEAAAKVLRNCSNVRFVMAGSGDMMDKMIMLAAERGIADRFHFPGFRCVHNAVGIRTIRHLAAGSHADGCAINHIKTERMRRNPHERYQDRLLGHRRNGRRHPFHHILPRDVQTAPRGRSGRSSPDNMGQSRTESYRHI